MSDSNLTGTAPAGPGLESCWDGTGHAFHPIFVQTSEPDVNVGLIVACGDFAGSIQLRRGGLLQEVAPVITAGLHYAEPWLRDASMNAWNAGSWLAPIAARNGLLHVVGNAESGYNLPHPDYYDGIIWVVAAHHHALISGDEEFLDLSFKVASDVLMRFRDEEYDDTLGLYRGGSFFNDGVSAYPDRFAQRVGRWGNIRDWLIEPSDSDRKGGGLPMACLSTNCLHLLALQSAMAIAERLGRDDRYRWRDQAQSLRDAIRGSFLLTDGRLGYLIDRGVLDDRQEIAGWAFACFSGVLDSNEQSRLASQVWQGTAGIPSLWPTYRRYADAGGVGRHSGLVWPQVAAVWGCALHRLGDCRGFGKVLRTLTEAASRHGQCAECWDFASGKMDGGLQERGSDGIVNYEAMPRTTWGATGILRLVIEGLAGARPDWDSCEFRPSLPPGMGPIRIDGLRWRGLSLSFELSGAGNKPVSIDIDGRSSGGIIFGAHERGHRRIRVVLGSAP